MNECPICKGKGYVYVDGDCGATGGNYNCIYCDGVGKIIPTAPSITADKGE